MIIILDSSPDPIYPSEAYPMNYRVTFYMTCMGVMPLCWLLSSGLLHCYMEKEKLWMEFRKEAEEKEEKEVKVCY